MRIVIDTNVVVSGVFFGGAPEQVLKAVSGDKVKAYATNDILKEYDDTIDELKSRYANRFDEDILLRFILKTVRINSETTIDICRDPDDIYSY